MIGAAVHRDAALYDQPQMLVPHNINNIAELLDAAGKAGYL